MTWTTDVGKLLFTVEDGEYTVERYLKDVCGVSRRLIQKLKHTPGGLTCNGSHIRTVDTVYSGDVIALTSEDETEITPNSSLRAEIVWEDDSLVIFNKPGGMPVHPSIRHRDDTLANLCAWLYPGVTFRAVNRLDKDTSGLCLVAKDPYSANLLQNSAVKVYYAAVHGMTEDSGTIDAPIAREQESIITRCVRGDGQHAVTHYRKVSGNDRYSLLKIDLETGRTHQIRVHFSYIGHPLAGDDLYGGSREDIPRQALHCGEMTVRHPRTGELMRFTAELPEDIRSLFG